MLFAFSHTHTTKHVILKIIINFLKWPEKHKNKLKWPNSRYTVIFENDKNAEVLEYRLDQCYNWSTTLFLTISVTQG